MLSFIYEFETLTNKDMSRRKIIKDYKARFGLEDIPFRMLGSHDKEIINWAEQLVNTCNMPDVNVRYFLVSYTCETAMGFSHGNLMVTHNGFPSNDYLKEHAHKRNDKSKNAVIQTIYEFESVEDWNAFNAR